MKETDKNGKVDGAQKISFLDYLIVISLRLIWGKGGKKNKNKTRTQKPKLLLIVMVNYVLTLQQTISIIPKREQESET